MKRSERLLKPDENLSIFKVKVYYTFEHFARPGMDAENTFYSFDFESEREKKPEKYSGKELLLYNGYRQLRIFLERLAHQGKLKRALFYANLELDKPLVDTITVSPNLIQKAG
jgi:hypothetical protein